MRILGIETSCDETAVCLIEAAGAFGEEFRFDILGNSLFSQAALHAPYGGVYPNLAKREHSLNLVPMLREALRQAAALAPADVPDTAAITHMREILVREQELAEALGAFVIEHGKPEIDAIAVTVGPGLEPALWVGINFARALSRLWDIPLVPVNHMEGHILLSLMESGRQRHVEFPMLALLISGGHTELVLSREFGHYEMIGETRDDAAGEAFDKVARLLDLSYPGGPEISRLAAQARELDLPSSITFTRPMLHDNSLDFSFSGLKTAVRTAVTEHAPLSENLKMEIAREFEDTVADVLVSKTMHAVDMHNIQTVVVGGGVSANDHIRTELAKAIIHAGNPARLLVPPPELATDNAIMIAIAGYFRFQRDMFADPDSLVAHGNLKLEKMA